MEIEQGKQEPNQEPNTQVEDLQKQINGLNKRNSLLETELKTKESSSTSTEERVAALELMLSKAEMKTKELEAFQTEGIDPSWSKLFEESDPIQRVAKLKEMLGEQKSSKDIKKIKEELGTTYPIKERKATKEGSMVGAEQLRGLSLQEINKLWTDGRIRGSK